MANQTPTEEKMHYESLMGLFKYALTFFSAIAIIITFLIGNNLNEIKKTVSEDVNQATKKLEIVKADADKTIADTKTESKELLQYTKDLTTMQISILKEDAKNLALSSARNKVEEAFKNNNIQTLIDATTKKEVSDNLKKIVKEETDKTRVIFNYMSKIQILYDRIGKQDVNSLYELDSLSNYCDNEAIQKLSKELLIQRGKEFEENYKFLSFSTTPVADSEDDFIQRLGLSNTSTKEEIVRKLVYEIKQRPQLDTLTRYYLLLRRKTGIDFKTFDSKPVFDWYNSNYRKK